MQVDQDILDALDLSKLKLPPEPKVLNIRHLEHYIDQTGDDTLRIYLTIDESTDVEKVLGGDITTLKRTIHDSLLSHGIELFPYVILGKPSEFAEVFPEE